MNDRVYLYEEEKTKFKECFLLQDLVKIENKDEAMEQAKRDSKDNQMPAVFHRKNNKKWKVTMELDDWIQIYNEYYSSKKLSEVIRERDNRK